MASGLMTKMVQASGLRGAQQPARSTLHRVATSLTLSTNMLSSHRQQHYIVSASPSRMHCSEHSTPSRGGRDAEASPESAVRTESVFVGRQGRQGRRRQKPSSGEGRPGCVCQATFLHSCHDIPHTKDILRLCRDLLVILK